MGVNDCIYKYKGRIYDEPPITNYVTVSKEYVPSYKCTVCVIKKNKVAYLSIVAVLLTLTLLGVLAWTFMKYMKQDTMLVKIPETMIYDKNNKILDVDIYNDASNLEDAHFSIKIPNGDTVIGIKDIKPGSSVGAIPLSKDIGKLPTVATVVYRVGETSIEVDVLIVDVESASKQFNKEF